MPPGNEPVVNDLFTSVVMRGSNSVRQHFSSHSIVYLNANSMILSLIIDTPTLHLLENNKYNDTIELK